MITLEGKLAHLTNLANAFLSYNPNKDNVTYLEIGAHRGRSIAVVTNILKDHVKNLRVIGYDIFGRETSEFHIAEDNGKGAGNFVKCDRSMNKIAQRNKNVTYQLIEGYTTDTLKPTIVDYAYIDGGHSYETVKWDHQQLKDSSVIIFDDSDLNGVNKYLWEIKDQYHLYNLGERQTIIINDKENFNFSTATGISEFQGKDPETYVCSRF
jgi:hypothetical protein